MTAAFRLLAFSLFVDANNVRHGRRCELADVLRTEPQRDGGWINAGKSGNPREAGPLLTTSYALMTMNQILHSISEEDPISERLSKQENLLNHAKGSY